MERNGPEPPHRELLRLAEQYPDASLLQLLDRIDTTAWQVEKITEDQGVLYARTNGLAALRLVEARLETFQADFALDAPPRTEQWLAAGEHLHLRRLIDPESLEALTSFCDGHLRVVGSPPVKVFDHPALLARLDLVGIVRRVLEALPRALPSTVTPAILKTRTLLRRTFPPSAMHGRIGNSNNQLWHQDSNIQFNDLPMLTLWAPLQDVSANLRPGLDLIDAPVAYFSARHGDSSPDLPAALAGLFPRARTVSVEAGAGDCIVFNGLTFHQTRESAAMSEHRDALLIRVLDAASAHLFAPDCGAKDVLVLD